MTRKPPLKKWLKAIQIRVACKQCDRVVTTLYQLQWRGKVCKSCATQYWIDTPIDSNESRNDRLVQKKRAAIHGHYTERELKQRKDLSPPQLTSKLEVLNRLL
jgi:hypothetical protein